MNWPLLVLALLFAIFEEMKINDFLIYAFKGSISVLIKLWVTL